MSARQYTWEGYCYPGTDVLRNKLGLRDQTLLTASEESRTLFRAAQLARSPIEGDFDYRHFKAVHEYLFQDVYEWAGQERTAPNGVMTKAGPDVVNFEPGDPEAPMVGYGYFPAGPALREHAEAQFARLARKDLMRGLTADEFCVELAEVWAELNVAHSFREGNTRTQVVFFSQLAAAAGRTLHVEMLATGQPLRDEFVAARFYSQATGRSDRLAAVIKKILAEPHLTSSHTVLTLARRATADAWAKDQLKSGAHPEYVSGMKLAKLTHPSDPTKRSTIGLHDDDDGPNNLGNSSSLTL